MERPKDTSQTYGKRDIGRQAGIGRFKDGKTTERSFFFDMLHTFFFIYTHILKYIDTYTYYIYIQYYIHIYIFAAFSNIYR